MDSDERPRSIRFPQWLWDEIDRDALRCKRSAVKQMEAIFSAYFRGDTTGLNLDRLGAMVKPTAASKIIDGSTDVKKRKTGT